MAIPFSQSCLWLLSRQDNCCPLLLADRKMLLKWLSWHKVTNISSKTSNRDQDVNLSSFLYHQRTCNLEKEWGFLNIMLEINLLKISLDLWINLPSDTINITNWKTFKQGNNQKREVSSKTVHQLENITASTISKWHGD